MDNEVPYGVQTFMGNVVEAIINPLLAIIFAAALAYFLWGLMVFILGSGDETKHTEGKQHMLWGVVGMTIMVSVFALIKMVLLTAGVDTELPETLVF